MGDFSLHLAPVFSPWLLGLTALVLTAGLVASWFSSRRALAARLLFSALVLAALLGPQLVETERTQQTSIGILVVDDSESQTLRSDAVKAAVETLQEAASTLPDFKWQIARYSEEAGADEASGTRLAETVRAAQAMVPPSQRAGTVLLTDGQLNDAQETVTAGGDHPVHAVITGSRSFQDRRLKILQEPAFAEVGRAQEALILVEDIGFDLPLGARVTWQLNDGPQRETVATPGTPLALSFTPDHRGANTLTIDVEPREGEATQQNNSAVLAINGVRNRLRVVLVSGEPYQGERLWRSTLKSDPSVDLVHFTILRLPTSRDVTPVSELSLIPFPTQELFEKNLTKFDLVIFDRYSMRGVLQQRYLANLADYVRQGGALLVAVGPEYGRDLSLYTTPLGDVLPVSPRGQILDSAFTPEVTTLGTRHPVTQGLLAAAPQKSWGPWFRLSAGEAMSGQTIMRGPLNLPLVVLDRKGEGRIAMVMSDQSWVWGRQVDGGGPYRPLIRRLVHWLMAEPDLEEEHLSAQTQGDTIVITRRSVTGPTAPVSINAPDGSQEALALRQISPGVYEARYKAPTKGVYRLRDDSGSALINVGAANRQEITDLEPTPGKLQTPITAKQGGLFWAEDGLPSLRYVDNGERRHGRGWLGLSDRRDGDVARIARRPLMPAWAWLIALCGSLLLCWWTESR